MPAYPNKRRPTVEAALYQLLIAGVLAEITEELLCSDDDQVVEVGFEKLNLLTEWLRGRFVNLDQASEQFKRMVMDHVKLKTIDVLSRGRGHTASVRAMAAAEDVRQWLSADPDLLKPE